MMKPLKELVDYIVFLERHVKRLERVPRRIAPTLSAYLHRQREWSQRTFGGTPRVAAITKHIEKELDEIRAKPGDLTEWIDVIILALDGYWRNGGDPDHIMRCLVAKQRVNFRRRYPMPTSDDEVSEHCRYLDKEPACNISGTCVAPKGAGSITNCMYCGKELHRHKDGLYYTWDADLHRTQRPQRQEG